ncbi:MAG: hypothetical protein KKD99_11090, partial [Proteobacteria bacterium]|nr:hypothetical protein [Pseudomonadota bacterium]
LNSELETYAQQIAEANKNLATQIRQLTTLHQAGRAITSSLDLNHTLEAILNMSSEIVESSAGAIKLIDQETKELKVAAQAGMLQDNGAPLQTYDLPLKIGERTIGVFEVVREATVELGQADRQLLETLAAQAAIEKTGARGLVSVIERVLIQFEKRLPSTQVKHVVVTPEIVEHPEAELERLLADPEDPERLARFSQAAVKERESLKESIRRREAELLSRYHLPLTETRVELLAGRYHHWDCDLKTAVEDLARLYDQVGRFAEKFLDNHGIELHFEPDAVDAILQQAVARDTSALAVCQEKAQDLEYALKLVRDRTSQDQFILTREALCDLDAYLNRVIREHYQTTLFRE